METNIIGLCLVTREAVKLMKKRDIEQGTIGHIVNINSIFGHKIHACVVSFSYFSNISIYNFPFIFQPGTKPLNGMYPVNQAKKFSLIKFFIIFLFSF